MTPQLAMTLVVASLLTGALLLLRPPGCQQEWTDTKPNDVLIASSQEKAGMLSQFASRYNKRGYLNDGLNPVRTCVYVKEVPSGDAESALETGWTTQPKPRPDVWAPASSAWVYLLLDKAPNQAALIPQDYYRKRLFSSPLVIGMPKPMADIVGSSVSWLDIHKLATNPAGWRAKGKPQWGPFRMVKTDPHKSTSGLHGLIGMYSDIRADRTREAVNASAAQAFAAAIESSVIHYGATARDFLTNLQDVDSHSSADPDHLAVLRYVSASPIEEKQIVDYNLGRSPRGPPPFIKLVPVYPTAAPTADHPYVILRWSGQPSDKLGAAEDFFNFVTAPAQQNESDQRGFRRADGVAGPWLRRQPYIDARPPNTIPLPSGGVIAAQIDAWDTLRRPARVMILIDRGADPPALREALSHLDHALSDFKGQDRVMVATFPAAPEGTGPYRVVQDFVTADPGHLPLLRQAIQVGGLATGRTPPNTLAATLQAATAWMVSTYDQGSINAILLVEMSPGFVDQPGDPGLLDYLRAQPRPKFVQIYCVGPPSNKRLEKVALAGGGASYAPDAASHFLRDAISNF